METPVFGYCDSCDDNTKYLGGKCRYCGADQPKEVKPTQAFKVSVDGHRRAPLHGRVYDNDVESIPPEHLLRDYRHDPSKTGAQVEKEYHAAVAAKRRAVQEGRGPADARLSMSIPAEVYHARMKTDRHYWMDKKNVERERKMWGI